MAKARRSNDRLSELCGEVGPEDGSDPRDFHSRVESKPNNRKALQLCQQVQRILYWAIGTECQDPVVRSLEVLSVEPAPNAARMLVTLGLPADERVTPEEVGERLGRVAGLLRAEVAEGITRRKTPDLQYRVVPIER